MSHVSFFRNFNLPHAERSLDDTLSAISGGAWKTQIAILRQHHANGNKADFERCKKALPAFTPSGTFTGGRKLEHLTQYSGFIILDIDKITPFKVPLVKDFSKTSPYTYACFISPSGEGLKILVRVNATPETHKETYLQLQAHYEKLLNLTIDKSGKDITRLCFVSYDPDTYINRDALLFNPVLTTTTKPTVTTHQSIPSAKTTLPKTPFDIYTDTVRFTCQKETYTEGNRNNFVYLLACNLNRNGISISDATDFIMRDYNFNDSEVRNAINSAYAYRQGMPCLSSKPGLSNTPNKKSSYQIKPNQEFDQDDSSFDDPLDDPKQERNITTNRFLLAQDYLNRHFEIRRNIVTQEYECRDLEKDEFLVMNENNIFIRMQVDGLNFSLPNLIALLKSEFIEDYNPFEEYFNNLPPWDGKTDYISFLTSFVHTADRQRFDLHFKKWLVRVVACALVDSVFNKQAFVLVHDKQNSGKSTFCRFLCPPDLQNYIAENLSIDKDSRILLCRNLLINLDELSTLSKIEINSLKSLFSKDKINERLPYDRRNSILPRRCSFIGSTNQVEFLNDETGSVRWLCFVIDEIDWSYAEKVNIDMVYAQAYHLFKSGFQYDISPEEVLENDQHNRQFLVVTPEKDLIIKYLTPATKAANHHFWTSTDIMLYLSSKIDNHYKMSPVNIGKALKICGFERMKNYTDKIFGYYIFCNDEPSP